MVAEAGIVIVGAGEAGARAAITLRSRRLWGSRRRLDRRGAARALYERPAVVEGDDRRSRPPRAVPTIGDAARAARYSLGDRASARASPSPSVDRAARARDASRIGACFLMTSFCSRLAPSRGGCRSTARRRRSICVISTNATALRDQPRSAGGKIAIVGGRLHRARIRRRAPAYAQAATPPSSKPRRES